MHNPMGACLVAVRLVYERAEPDLGNVSVSFIEPISFIESMILEKKLVENQKSR